jgi:hypothetical protein
MSTATPRPDDHCVPHKETAMIEKKVRESVWGAHGEYKGETHQVQGATQGVAVNRWREWAKYNGG